ncbi:MAG TPA: hypothetical protein DDY91_10920 [Planctomycetaceae bacterium]|nr:hypothetical protein [Planctomycetaceae bacterium]
MISAVKAADVSHRESGFGSFQDARVWVAAFSQPRCGSPIADRLTALPTGPCIGLSPLLAAK